MLVTLNVFFVSSSATARADVLKPESPTISCDIKNCLEPSTTACTVSNGEYVRIGLTVCLKGNSFKEIGRSPINPLSPSLQQTYYSVQILKEPDGSVAPVKIVDVHQHKTADGEIREIRFEIREAAEVRRSKVAKWWSSLKKNANAAEKSELRQTIVTDEAVIQGIESRMIDNAIGKYTLVCTFISTNEAIWAGRVSSVPVNFQVVAGHTILDQSVTK